MDFKKLIIKRNDTIVNKENHTYDKKLKNFNNILPYRVIKQTKRKYNNK